MPRREFTVAVFVVHQDAVLLHWHRKLRRWLPPGGHVEPDELPDEAAIRETREEAGLQVELLEGAHLPGVTDVPALADGPRRLAQPLGIQLEDIPPDHQHVDLIYLARPAPGSSPQPAAPLDDPGSQPAWYPADALPGLGLTEEVQRWARAAIAAARTARPVPHYPAATAPALVPRVT